jgi:hypothetical protein
MKKLLITGIFLALAYFSAVESGYIPRRHDAGISSVSGADQITAAFENHRSNVQVHGRGEVAKVLPDDREGSPHQRFLVRLASGKTLLVAHNIELADRVAALKAGDRVEFSGEYEWNARGGVIHWTHRDPRHSHVDGWIKHNGRKYQ